jgi:hypothetical protein
MLPWACVLLAMTVLPGVAEPALSDSQEPDRFATNACVQCHRDLPGRSSQIVDLEWKHSVHYAAGVGCDGCHGGDPSVNAEQFQSRQALKLASHRRRNPEFLVLHDTGREFVSSVRGRSVSYFCGMCHDEIKEKHLGSPHGKFGDPTCLYCHGQGSHKIEEPTLQIIDTRSRAEGGRCSPTSAVWVWITFFGCVGAA